MNSLVRATEALLAVVATSAIAWWVVGDRSDNDGYDRMFSAPWAGVDARVIALVGLVVLVLCVRALLRSSSTTAAAAATIGGAMAAGVVLGSGLRVLNSSTDGANIGGGGVVLVGLPVVALLTLATITVAALTGRTERRERQP